MRYTTSDFSWFTLMLIVVHYFFNYFLLSYFFMSLNKMLNLAIEVSINFDQR